MVVRAFVVVCLKFVMAFWDVVEIVVDKDGGGDGSGSVLVSFSSWRTIFVSFVVVVESIEGLVPELKCLDLESVLAYCCTGPWGLLVK